MESKELRIGNLVNYRGFPSMVGAISSNETYIYLDKGIVNPKVEDIEPIPLTEEWLLKFGFEKVSWSNDVRINLLNRWSLIYDFDVNKLCVDSGLNANYLQIKYIHQLQNLYFTLTGEELTLKN
jgi:hypothetical protein